MNNEKSPQPFVIVGLSGGVDSSVAAFLLKQKGYRVEGLFMKNWEDDGNDDNCTAENDLLDVKMVCKKLGIRLHTVNFATEYWDRVFMLFLDEYKAGRTPNPDVLCNKEIKFKAFLDYAMELGADYIATGHFVQKSHESDEYQLLKGVDSNKDQSYFLYLLNQKQIEKALFPVGHLTKPEVRQIAKDIGLRNHDKKDSTGICFIGERKFKEFLSRYLPAKPGEIVTENGEVVGQHDGLMYYTIGQRSGIGIGGMKDANELPWYVIEKDLKKNILIVGQGVDNPKLFSKKLIADQLHWIAGHAPEFPLNCTAKIRYRQSDQACQITQVNNDKCLVTFDEPQRAITPGQSIVFYQNDVCLGGGIIVE